MDSLIPTVLIQYNTVHCFFYKLLPILDIKEEGNVKLFIIGAVRALHPAVIPFAPFLATSAMVTLL